MKYYAYNEVQNLFCTIPMQILSKFYMILQIRECQLFFVHINYGISNDEKSNNMVL